MTSPLKLTESGLARELGVSRQAIHDLVKRAILSKDEGGMIDVDKAKAALLDRVRPSGKTSEAAQKSAPPINTSTATGIAPPAVANTAVAAALQATAIEVDENAEITSYHVAKTLREAAEAQIARIKLAEMQNKYLDKIKVDSSIFEVARAMRDGLTNCARRIAADVATLVNAEDCEAIIDREHRALMDSMSQRILAQLGKKTATSDATPEAAAT